MSCVERLVRDLVRLPAQAIGILRGELRGALEVLGAEWHDWEDDYEAGFAGWTEPGHSLR